jgi:hypothetical protein
MDIINEISICSDCLIWIANADDSGMSDEQADATKSGEERLCADGARVVADGSALGFRCTQCNCCASGLFGDRFLALTFKAGV